MSKTAETSLKYPAICLSVAGSDPCGGAGLQADLKVFQEHGVYGTGVVTMLTVQNSTKALVVECVSADLVAKQIEAVLEDYAIEYVKLGALGNAEIVCAVSEIIKKKKLKAILDPVISSKHGAVLLSDTGVQALRSFLIPETYLLTPNLDEASNICGYLVSTVLEMGKAAQYLANLGAKNVLIKGGHLNGDKCIDCLLADGKFFHFESSRIPNKNSHGTGCVLSAAITARLSKGEALVEAVNDARSYLAKAIASAPDIARGSGPVNFFVGR